MNWRTRMKRVLLSLTVITLLLGSCASGAPLQPPEEPQGLLTISLAQNNPVSQGVVMGSKDVSFLEAKFTASNENILIKSIPVVRNSGDDNDIVCVNLYNDATKLGQSYLGAAEAGKAFFNFPAGSELMIDQLNPKTFTVKADIADYQTVKSGTEVGFNIDVGGIVAVGAASGRTITATGTAEGNTMVLFRTIPVISLSASSPSGIGVPSVNEEIFRFTVTAANTGFDLNIDDTEFTLSSDNAAALATLDGQTSNLFKSTDLTKIVGAATTFVPSGQAYGYTVIHLLPGEETVGSGMTNTYVLKAYTADINMEGENTLTVQILSGNFFWNDGAGLRTNMGVSGLPIVGGTLTYGGPPPKPDLIVESVDFQPKNPKVGDIVKMNPTIKNNGTKPVDIYYDRGTPFWVSREIPGTNPAQSSEKAISWTASDRYINPGGTITLVNLDFRYPGPGYHFEITVDKAMEGGPFVDESDENNNVFSGEIDDFLTLTPSITLLSPNGGEEWTIGETYDIRWESQGLETVAGINLIDYTPGDRYGYQYGITSMVPASLGNYSWMIPANITPGDKYKVVIGYEATNDFSDDYFTIKPQPFLTLLSPVTGNKFFQRDNITIGWSSGGIDCIDIDLQDWNRQQEDGSTPFVLDIAVNQTAETGEFSWTIPFDWPTGDKYKIKISTPDNLISYASGYFSIIAPESPPSEPPAPKTFAVPVNYSALEAFQQAQTGDTILLNSGAYSLNGKGGWPILPGGVIIQGAGEKQTFLFGIIKSDGDLTNTTGDIILKDLTIVGPADSRAVVYGGKQIALDNTTVIANGPVGVFAGWKDVSLKLNGSTFINAGSESNSIGVEVAGELDPHNNVVQGNIFVNQKCGLSVPTQNFESFSEMVRGHNEFYGVETPVCRAAFG